MSRTSKLIQRPTGSGESVIRTLLITDLVDSTKLVSELGDRSSAEIFALHDRIARDILARYDGHEIDKTDGFLFLFEAPSHAVLFAIEYHEELASLSREKGVPLAARSAIHLGEVILRENSPADVARGAKPVELEGFAKPTVARLMALALGRQTLMTKAAFDIARRALGTRLRDGDELRWLAHGPYLFKGVDEPVEVCEAGIVGFAPLAPPPEGEKARRAIAPGDELTLGWRPARGQEIPNRRNWFLEEKLGEGGFGEVWVAARGKSSERRVFKFCFAPDRLRALKREVTLFRLLQESLGQREDIARILDWQFDEAPYFIESEYTAGGNFAEWFESNGKNAIPRATILELVAEVADALGAAHSVGVLHKDIKPSNILIYEGAGKKPHARLTDFGIGLVTNSELLAQKGITSTGMTNMSLEGSSSGAGTRMYMAPEVIEGKASSTRSDIYSLGVMLFQLVIGDLSKSLAPGWERDVTDDFLEEDIKLMVDGDPENRFSSCDEVAERLRTLERRREERIAEEKAKEQAIRTEELLRKAQAGRARARFFLVAGFFTLLVAGAAIVYMYNTAVRAGQLRQEAETQSERANLAAADAKLALVKAEESAEETRKALTKADEELYQSSVLIASLNAADNAFGRALKRLWSAPEDKRQIEWGYLLASCRLDLLTLKDMAFGHRDVVVSAEFSGDGRELLTASWDNSAILWDAENGKALARLAAPRGDAQSEGARLDTFVGLQIRGRFHLAKFSPAGDRIVTAFPSEHIAQLYDAAGKPVAALKGHTDTITAICFDGRGEYIATSSLDGTIRVWDADKGGELHVLEGHKGPVWSVVFTPRSSSLLSSGEDGTAKFWALQGGAALATFDGDDSPICYAETDPLEQYVLTSSSKGQAKLYSLMTKKVVALIDDEMTALTRARFLPGGAGRKGIFLAARDRTIRTYVDYDLSPSLQYRLSGHSAGINDIVSNADGSLLLSCSFDGTARVWTLDKTPSFRELRGHADRVFSGSFNPTSNRIATASADTTGKVWSQVAAEHPIRLKSDNGPVRSVMFSANGSGFVSVSAPGPDAPASLKGVGVAQVYRNDLSKFKGELFSQPGDGVRDAALSSTGEFIALGFASGTVIVRTTDDKKDKVRLRNTGTAQVTAVRFSSDDNLLAVGDETGSIRIFDVATGQMREGGEAKVQGGISIRSLRFSPDGTRLLAVVRGDRSNEASGFRIWQLDNLKAAPIVVDEIDVIGGGQEDKRVLVASADWSPDGTHVVVATMGRYARIYDLSDPNPATAPKLEAHTSRLTDAKYSKDGKRILTSSADNSIIIWEPGTGRELATLRGDEGSVINGFGIAPDGMRIVAASAFLDMYGNESAENGSTLVWNLAPWSEDLLKNYEGQSWQEKFESWHTTRTSEWDQSFMEGPLWAKTAVFAVEKTVSSGAGADFLGTLKNLGQEMGVALPGIAAPEKAEKK